MPLSNRRSGPDPLRTPARFANAIAWEPLEPAPAALWYGPPIVVTQHALRECLDHLRAAPDHELLGFLLGQIREDPRSGDLFLLIDTAIPTRYAIPETEPVPIPDEEWLGAQVEARRRRAMLVGWYHGAAFVGPRPTLLDAQAQITRFPEPWMCGLVISTEGVPAGGFFRALPARAPGTTASAESEAPDRDADAPPAAFVPFHELLERGARLDDGRWPTLVDWTNYRTDAPVVPDDSAAAPLGHAPSAALPTSGVDAPDDALLASVPLLIPEAAAEATARHSLVGRRTRLGALAAVAVVAVAAGLGWFAFGQRAIPEPPTAAPAPVPSVPAAPISPVATGSTSPAAPAAPADSAPTAIADSATAPSPGAPAESQTAEGSIAPPAATMPPTESAAAPAAPDATSLVGFDSLADSLAATIRNYHDRRLDYGLGHIGCAGLAVGSGATNDALVSLALRFHALRDSLDADRASRYRSLEREVGEVNRDFQGTACGGE